MRKRPRVTLFGVAMTSACLIAGSVIFPGARAAWAQQSITSATLTGHVEDSNGGAIDGAMVTVKSFDRNQTLTVKTDET